MMTMMMVDKQSLRVLSFLPLLLPAAAAAARAATAAEEAEAEAEAEATIAQRRQMIPPSKPLLLQRKILLQALQKSRRRRRRKSIGSNRMSLKNAKSRLIWGKQLRQLVLFRLQTEMRGIKTSSSEEEMKLRTMKMGTKKLPQPAH